MNYLSRILFFSLLLFKLDLGLAQEVCVNNPPKPSQALDNSEQTGTSLPVQTKAVPSFKTTKNSQYSEINRLIRQGTDPLTKSFHASRSAQGGFCLTCGTSSQTQSNLNQVNEVLQQTVLPLKIKKDCIVAALQREIQQTGSICDGNKPLRQFDNGGKTAPCLHATDVDYIHYSVNLALQCLATVKAPLDARVVMKKINNESGFNFFLAYVGGVGALQLTSDAVKDMSSYKPQPNSSTIVGSGRYIVEGVLNSQNKACQPFAEVLKNDIKKRPPYPGRNSYCSWVSTGEGFARNLIYAMGYYLHNRDDIIAPKLRSISPHLAENQEILNALTLLSYSSEGRAGAFAAIRNLRLSKNSKPAEVVQAANKKYTYLRETDKKMRELLENIHGPRKMSADEIRGNTCVE
ncbi:MAG: hypothetical protein AAGB31_10250 [Bdellovibrio sp.]